MNESQRNRLNGILGTVIFHLIIILIFFVIKLGEARKKHAETLQIEFLNELVKIEEYLAEKDPLPDYIPSLDDQSVRNIAVNVAEKLNHEISTEKYLEEVKEELGIEELNQQLEREIPEDNSPQFVEEPDEKTKEIKPKEEQYKGKTRISVNMPNRSIRRQHVPIYKCEISGIVVINIVVDQTGNVISADYSGSSNTRDECLIEEAKASAYRFLFSADLKGEPRQRGTITFEFLPQ
ncbi:MAG: energy transducer TonB [Bacteroidales bacterium]|nr:energy transducer TonB [Bacteroidales bacterium]